MSWSHTICTRFYRRFHNIAGNTTHNSNKLHVNATQSHTKNHMECFLMLIFFLYIFSNGPSLLMLKKGGEYKITSE